MIGCRCVSSSPLQLGSGGSSSSTSYLPFLLLAVSGLVGYYIFRREMFHFQVTPWKTTCLRAPSKRCPQCCRAGFNGQPVHFEYTFDAERMNAQINGQCTEMNQAACDSGITQTQRAYVTLGNTWK